MEKNKKYTFNIEKNYVDYKCQNEIIQCSEYEKYQNGEKGELIKTVTIKERVNEQLQASVTENENINYEEEYEDSEEDIIIFENKNTSISIYDIKGLEDVILVNKVELEGTLYGVEFLKRNEPYSEIPLNIIESRFIAEKRSSKTMYNYNGCNKIYEVKSESNSNLIKIFPSIFQNENHIGIKFDGTIFKEGKDNKGNSTGKQVSVRHAIYLDFFKTPDGKINYFIFDPSTAITEKLNRISHNNVCESNLEARTNLCNFIKSVVSELNGCSREDIIDKHLIYPNVSFQGCHSGTCALIVANCHKCFNEYIERNCYNPQDNCYNSQEFNDKFIEGTGKTEVLLETLVASEKDFYNAVNKNEKIPKEVKDNVKKLIITNTPELPDDSNNFIEIKIQDSSNANNHKNFFLRKDCPEQEKFSCIEANSVVFEGLNIDNIEINNGTKQFVFKKEIKKTNIKQIEIKTKENGAVEASLKLLNGYLCDLLNEDLLNLSELSDETLLELSEKLKAKENGAVEASLKLSDKTSLELSEKLKIKIKYLNSNFSNIGKSRFNIIKIPKPKQTIEENHQEKIIDEQLEQNTLLLPLSQIKTNTNQEKQKISQKDCIIQKEQQSELNHIK